MKKIYYTPVLKTVILAADRRFLQGSDHDGDMDFDNPGEINPGSGSDDW